MNDFKSSSFFNKFNFLINLGNFLKCSIKYSSRYFYYMYLNDAPEETMTYFLEICLVYGY